MLAYPPIPVRSIHTSNMIERNNCNVCGGIVEQYIVTMNDVSNYLHSLFDTLVLGNELVEQYLAVPQTPHLRAPSSGT